MIESPHGRYQPLGLPVYSLYSETRRPTAEGLFELLRAAATPPGSR